MAAPLDLDVVVEGDALAAATSAAERLGGEVTAHERFGTATVRADDLAFDLGRRAARALQRARRAARGGAGGAGEDLGRRDFTVNTIRWG